jgi:hypothetical protein
MAKSKVKSMAEVTAGYEQFIKGKELSNNARQLFEKVVSKAANTKPKQSASKRPQT